MPRATIDVSTHRQPTIARCGPPRFPTSTEFEWSGWAAWTSSQYPALPSQRRAALLLERLFSCKWHLPRKVDEVQRLVNATRGDGSLEKTSIRLQGQRNGWLQYKIKLFVKRRWGSRETKSRANKSWLLDGRLPCHPFVTRFSFLLFSSSPNPSNVFQPVFTAGFPAIAWRQRVTPRSNQSVATFKLLYTILHSKQLCLST